MESHTIFVEGHWQNDDSVGLVVLCECGALLWEAEQYDSQPQVSLDEINEVRWRHYDTVEHAVPVCDICGDSDD